MARRLIHSEISQDIEGFLATDVKRMDSKGKQSQNNTYTIKNKEEVYEFEQGQLAPPVDLVFITGPPGPRNRRAPASIPGPAPVNGPG